MISRVRLRECDNWTFPFRTFYLVSEAHVPGIYRMFGTAFSMKITAGFRAEIDGKLVDYTNRTKARVRVRIPAGDNARCVVVLRHLDRGNGSIAPFIVQRFFAREGRVGASARNTEKLIDAASSSFHVGPGEDGVKPICFFCSRQVERLMGMCVPGEQACQQNVTVPLSALTQKRR